MKADMKTIPVIIGNRDRVSPLKLLIQWLQNTGFENIYIIDNGSTYRPLLEYYGQIVDQVTITTLYRNIGSRALWRAPGLAKKLIDPEKPFILNDSDIVPSEDCPGNVLEFLFDVMRAFPERAKIGLGLELSDLPDCYAPKQIAIDWESQHWEKELPSVNGTKIYHAGVATTFALYPRFTRPFDFYAVRTGYPYVARHLDWYIDSEHPTEEEIYDDKNASKGNTQNWGVRDCHGKGIVARYLERTGQT